MAEETRRTATRRTTRDTRPSRSERRSQATRETRQPKRRVTLRERWEGFVHRVQANPRPFVALGVLVALVVMLYGPARSYYVARRSNEDLQRYLAAVEQQNELLKDDLGRLQSEEGIEDEARRKGYVKEDETSVTVDGLPDADLMAMLGDIQLEDNRPWYVKALDAVFFYSQDSWQ